MGAFATIVEVMAGMDVFQLFFPWLLVFSISYGVLTSSSIITDDESVNGVIALALAFIAIGGAYFFIPAGLYTHFGAALSFGVLAIVGLVVMMGLAGYDMENFADSRSAPPVGLAIIIFVISFIGVLAFQLPITEIIGAAGGGSSDLFDDVIMPVLVLVFLLAVVAVTMREGE